MNANVAFQAADERTDQAPAAAPAVTVPLSAGARRQRGLPARRRPRRAPRRQRPRLHGPRSRDRRRTRRRRRRHSQSARRPQRRATPREGKNHEPERQRPGRAGPRLTKEYRRDDFVVTALDKVDPRHPRQGVFLFDGSLGLGKSTLLHLIAGIDKPTSGEILVLGEDIASLAEKKMASWRSEKSAMSSRRST